MKDLMTGTFTYNDDTYNFNFATNISAFNKLIFVNSVVETIVDGENYNSVVRDLIFDFNIIDVFTNIDTSFIDVEDDDGNKINPIILIEHFLEKSNVVDIVKANMRSGLLEELNKAVDLNIQYLTGIHPNILNDALVRLVDTFEKKIDQIDLNSMMDMAKMFTSMTEDFTLNNVVNAYMESEMHKKNLAEIAEAKK